MAAHWQKIGHRGAPREFPANTMRSFERAVELGCTMVECDVRASLDGTLVLAHDPEVRDTSGRVYPIEGTVGGVLGALDLGAGEGVPTLQELADWANGRCSIMADMKCEGNGVEEKTVGALAFLPHDTKIVSGAGAAGRQEFHAADPTLPLSLTLSVGDNLLADDAAFDALLPTIHTQAVTCEYPLLTAQRIMALHARGLRVYAWTVDDLPTMRHLLDLGVDGLISNRPDLFQNL